MAAGIRDVARAAGVSTATVSRIINDSPRIAPETRERVLEVMRDLQYVPNSLARNLSNASSQTIGLLVDMTRPAAFGNPFFYQMLNGAEQVVYQHGYYLIIANEKGGSPTVLENLVLGKRIDAAILPSSIVTEDMVMSLREKSFPFVVMGEPQNLSEDVPWVDVDNVQAGALATRHLIEKGYRRIAYLGGSQQEMFNRHRLKGYRQTLSDHQLPAEEAYVLECPEQKQAAYEAVKALMALPQPPDAILCAGNKLCLGAMRALSHLNIAIPEKCGLITFDDEPITELIEPTLTAVDIDVYRMGQEAAAALFSQISPDEKEAPRHILLQPRIIQRSSSRRVGMA